ncbi:MAG: O6-methylguanine-DNA--protein-cysteine methyltransferase [Candidatus Adlerbacteria bacterium]|nr:O6-methylguanine-DNA--protein-cysteine methyltransferase [Candidatus Adlerbacteria bacterium]
MKKKSSPASSSKLQKAARVFETPFAEKVYAVVAKIAKGKTMTYGQVAAKAGKPGAARAVGTIMSHNYRPNIPCHRVIRADGRVGDYNRGGSARKTELLREEGFLK